MDATLREDDIVVRAGPDAAPRSVSAGAAVRARRATGKVLHVLKIFRPDFTGAGIFLERASLLFDELAPGVEHDLLVIDTLRPTAPVRAKSRLRNIIYLQDVPKSPWQAEFALVGWLFRNRRRYDVIHFHTHADRFFLGYLLIKLLGKRLIITATLDDSARRLVETYRPLYRPLVRAVLRLFDAFIAISPKLYGETAAVLGPAKVHLVPIGVAIPPYPNEERAAERAQYGLSRGDLALIFVGGICARKDPIFLIEHMPAICAFWPDAKLFIVGPILEPDYYARLLDCIGRHKLEDRVILTGEVADPYPLFALADIVVFASHLEGFGCAVTEGMAHGLPAVVRHLPGVNELFIRDGETGLFFTSSAEYLLAIRRLIENPALRREMGMAARTLVAAEFDNQKNAKSIMTLYGFPHMDAKRQ
jgi:glycosyltransferase involved in cell wall biosynthesis